jgi:P-type E1-E2 ATPase
MRLKMLPNWLIPYPRQRTAKKRWKKTNLLNATSVQIGEIVVVGVSESVPVDGRVVEGAALVNQAAVTGDLPGCQFH